MKRLILGMGSIIAIGSPIAAVVSCGSEPHEDKPFKLTKDQSPDGREHYYLIKFYANKNYYGLQGVEFEISKTYYELLGGK